MTDRTITLVSAENAEFQISEKVAKMSGLIAGMLDSDICCDCIPVEQVKTDALKKIVEYLNHHQGRTPDDIDKPLQSTDLLECGVEKWDDDFINLDHEEIFELILAANYLDVKSLLELACAKVATLIKGKKPEEIRKQFNIVNDFSPEEELQVREENRWCEEA